eukprot:CAMPEP_0198204018 /NCGR_PEP_ID=MMETSP1445-20131203/7374_1 /TAXON_ID=36898 /ORGANISM="Pyramimonas sp., Strain CCMP2087" /LENGTH=190 /DNA_ID=CAMNT_0043875679 /DNA_START=202 /DNA_END=774 /DNA_ORIENTATION=-
MEWYCDAKCQKMRWKGHKLECKAPTLITQVHPEDFDYFMNLQGILRPHLINVTAAQMNVLHNVLDHNLYVPSGVPRTDLKRMFEDFVRFQNSEERITSETGGIMFSIPVYAKVTRGDLATAPDLEGDALFAFCKGAGVHPIPGIEWMRASIERDIGTMKVGWSFYQNIEFKVLVNGNELEADQQYPPRST